MCNARKDSETVQLAIAVLTPADDVDAALTASVRRALAKADAVPAEIDAADAFVLVGGLESRCFLHDGAVRADVVNAVRKAYTEGRWIAAPGVAVAAVMHALAAELAAGRANRRQADEGVAVFPDLRLVCLARPMLCEIEGERDAAVDRVVARLITRAAAA